MRSPLSMLTSWFPCSTHFSLSEVPWKTFQLVSQVPIVASLPPSSAILPACCLAASFALCTAAAIPRISSDQHLGDSLDVPCTPSNCSHRLSIATRSLGEAQEIPWPPVTRYSTYVLCLSRIIFSSEVRTFLSSLGAGSKGSLLRWRI